MRRFDRTPQELQPAKVPTLLIFSAGTLAWVSVLLFLGARNVLGYGVDVRIASVAGIGVLLGLGGMLWARLRGQREGTATGVPETTTARTAPVATASREPTSSKPTSSTPPGSQPPGSQPEPPETQDQP